jgi:hypothetical protein
MRRMRATRPEGGAIAGWGTIAVGIALLVGTFFVLPGRVVSKSDFPRASPEAADVLYANDERLKQENDVRTTGVQALGGAVLLFGLLFTYRTFRLTRDGQITDRFSKAVDQLAGSKLPQCLGGIYSLERVARVSKYDHGVVLETLVDFLRASLPADGSPAHTEQRLKIQAVITVLGRRRTDFDVPDRWLRLNKLNLSGLAFDGGDFGKANFRGSTMIRATFIEARLEGTIFSGAHLQKAVFASASCKGAKFDGAHLEDAETTTAKALSAVNAHCGPGIGPHGDGTAQAAPPAQWT